DEEQKLCHKPDALTRGWGPPRKAPRRSPCTRMRRQMECCDALVRPRPECSPCSAPARAWRMLRASRSPAPAGHAGPMRAAARLGRAGAGRDKIKMESTMTKAEDRILAAAQKRAAELELPYYGAILPGEAHTLLAALPNARLIDVRTRPEWEYVGHVPGSVLIEWTTYPAGTRNPRFIDELRAAATDPEAPLLFLCRSGQRSDSAARAAAAAGYR